MRCGAGRVDLIEWFVLERRDCIVYENNGLGMALEIVSV
jgi:hypothetical protein